MKKSPSSTRRDFITRSALAASGITVGLNSLANGATNSANAAKTPPRPICAFTKCLQFLTFPQIGEAMAQMGFDGADVTVRPGGQIEPEQARKELPEAVKTLSSFGIALPMIVTAVTDTNDRAGIGLLETAAEAGIKYYRMGWLAYDFKKTMQQNLDGFKHQLERLAKLNEKLGLHGGYQNHSGLHVGAPVWDLYELLKDIDPRFLGVQYDIRHATTEGGYSWMLGMKRVEPWIRTICIKDFIWGKDPGGVWRHQNVPLGQGMVSFDEFLKEYASLHIEAPVSIHYEYDLGGAELGKKETTMKPETIFQLMQSDLGWLRNRLTKNL